MKKSISIIAFAFFCIMSMSAQNPTPSEFNWISVQTYLSRDGYGFEDITFYDGLGIPAQIVSVNASASDMPENIITPLYYDNMGRESRSYLPYVSGNSGPYIDLSPFIMQYNYYANKYGNDEARYAFTEVMYDNTPLNRIATTYNVGSVFRSGKFTEHCYESNSTDEVKKFEYPPLNGNIMWNCYYNANTLYKISATNEDGNKTTEFKNHKGQTILSRNESDSELLDTYYIYDDAGNLCYVLPPELISKINNPSVTGLYDDSPEMRQYAFVYRYDDRYRCVEKRIPGKDWEYMVYDKGGRLVLYQDGNQRLDGKNQWTYNVYDNFSRLIEQTVVSTELCRDSMQKRYDHAGFNNSYPGLGNSVDMLKPFGEGECSLIGHLVSNRYGGHKYYSREIEIIEREVEHIPVSRDFILIVNSEELSESGADSFEALLEVVGVSGKYFTPDGTLLPFLEIKGEMAELYFEDHLTAYYVPMEFLDPISYTFYTWVPSSDPPFYMLVEQTIVTTLIEILMSSPGCYEHHFIPEFEPAEEFVIRETETVIIDLESVLTIPYYLEFEEVDNVINLDDVDARNNNLMIYQKVAVLNGSPEDECFVERAYYYDYKGRVIQTVEKNHTGGISRFSTKYDFVGNMIASHESHATEDGGAVNVRLAVFTYDHRGRLISEATSVNGSAPAAVYYGYDELGELVTRTYGTGANAVTENMSYNIQGWLTGQDSDLFSMNLRYYDPDKGTTPSFTGNITEWVWQHKGDDMISPAMSTYAYGYDKLSRLRESILYEGTSITPTNSFSERGITYDMNGNILSMKRYQGNAHEPCHDMAFTVYNGNQLSVMVNNNTLYSYEYDANGNMTLDSYKALKLDYNFLNLVESVSEITPSGMRGPTVAYTWLADSTKLQVEDADGNGYLYLGSLVYSKHNGGDWEPESTSFGSGRIIASQGPGGETLFTPYYHLTDHLGSVRTVFTYDTLTGVPEVIARNDYHAFGLQHENPLLIVGSDTENRFLYNGKEKQTTGSLGLLDYGARMYDPVVGRWPTVDPLAEKYYPISPYAYAANNPILYIDPNGMWVEDKNGNLVAEERDNAYTFAKYLNTSPIIAMVMLAEQGYNVEKGILKLKVGDVFQVEHFAASPESRESLGLIGNKIRDNAGSELGKNLFENYWNGSGDIELSGKQFAGMLIYIKNNDPQVVATSPATSTLGEMTVDGTANVVSFYGNNEYERAYGSASVYYNQHGRAVGFYDVYDFNKQPWGNRTVKNELITRGVNFVSPKKAQPFSVRYGFSSR